ncbi:MAG: MFS transporter, partial [bacterium]
FCAAYIPVIFVVFTLLSFAPNLADNAPTIYTAPHDYHGDLASAVIADFSYLLRKNRNCRYTWLGQVIGEIGTHFNNIAVAALVLQVTGSGLAVGAMLMARAIPAMLAGSVAGVALDRYDRRRIMIAADIARAAVAAAFLLAMSKENVWLVYPLSAALMLASPFFTSGRISILPAIAPGADLHTANSLTQTTQWGTQIIGTMLAGYTVAWLGYGPAFVINAIAFLLSASTTLALRLPPGAFRARRADLVKAAAERGTGSQTEEPPMPAGHLRPWHDFRDGLRFFAHTPLVLGIGLLSVGWAAGGGAAQLLFVLFGEQVFDRGPEGVGSMSGFAGIGLLIGGLSAHSIGRRVGFRGYKRTVSLAYLSHGLLFILFSLTQGYLTALIVLAASRVGMAISSVLNTAELLKYAPDHFRGRVFGTMESLRWSTMILSMAAASFASDLVSPRAIGVVAGVFGAVTGLAWAWADWRGKLPEPTPAATLDSPR